jgi:hypothetical protein
MLKDLEFSELDDKNKGYRMVQGRMGITCTSMPGVWNTSTTLLEDVCLAYNYQRQLSEFEKSLGEFYDILHGSPPDVGIWGEDEDEDI